MRQTEAAASGGVVVGGVLGVIEDMIDVFGICALDEDDVGTPFVKVVGDLDELVLGLSVGLAIMVEGADRSRVRILTASSPVSGCILPAALLCKNRS